MEVRESINFLLISICSLKQNLVVVPLEKMIEKCICAYLCDFSVYLLLFKCFKPLTSKMLLRSFDRDEVPKIILPTSPSLHPFICDSSKLNIMFSLLNVTTV